MTNKVKGWLMLSPLIVIVYGGALYYDGWISFFILLSMPLLLIYILKAVILLMDH